MSSPRLPFDPMQSAAMRGPAAAAPTLSAQSAGTAERPITISQANTLLSHALAASLPAQFFVQGEISNFKASDRGHAYFTLKDAAAELPCILWKDGMQRLKFKPKDGLAVMARGGVRLYEPQGRIQLYVDTLIPLGAGALELAFRQLCEKLRAEGLFESQRKRPIPRVPSHVVIITSRTGSVLHDVLTTALRRFPGLRVSLFSVRVQGDGAAGDMVRAIQRVNRHAEKLAESANDVPPDLILLVRGGGSLEDLWAFNEEILARAIVASRIPIATGIGHEPDTTIADLVGDRRGATPTAVTELTIPDARALSAELTAKASLLTRDLRQSITQSRHVLDRTALELSAAMLDGLRRRQMNLDDFARQITRIEPRHAIAQGWRRVEDCDRRLRHAAATRLRRQAEQLTGLGHRLERSVPAAGVLRARDRLAHLDTRLASALKTNIASTAQRLTAAERQLHAVSPSAVLQRGYSITTDKQGRIVRSTAQVQRGDVITTKVSDGEITSTVGKPKQATLF